MTPLEQALQRLRDPDEGVLVLAEAAKGSSFYSRRTLASTYLQALADVRVVMESMDEARMDGIKMGLEAAASLPPYETNLGNGQILRVSNAESIRNLNPQDIMEGK